MDEKQLKALEKRIQGLEDYRSHKRLKGTVCSRM